MWLLICLKSNTAMDFWKKSNQSKFKKFNLSGVTRVLHYPFNNSGNLTMKFPIPGGSKVIRWTLGSPLQLVKGWSHESMDITKCKNLPEMLCQSFNAVTKYYLFVILSAPNIVFSTEECHCGMSLFFAFPRYCLWSMVWLWSLPICIVKLCSLSLMAFGWMCTESLDQ